MWRDLGSGEALMLHTIRPPLLFPQSAASDPWLILPMDPMARFGRLGKAGSADWPESGPVWQKATASSDVDSGKSYGYGYRDKDYMKLKIIQACSPWMGHFRPWGWVHVANFSS